MASLALHLKSHHHKTQQTILNCTPNLTFSHLFSSESHNDDNTPKPSNFSSYFSDIKSSLKRQQSQQQQQSTPFKPSNFAPQNPTKITPLEGIRKNLTEYRRRTSAPAPNSTENRQPTLFQDLYKRNVTNLNPNPKPGETGDHSFQAIRESLQRLMKTSNEKGKNVNEQMSLNKYKESFRLRPPMAGSDNTKVIGGSPESLPALVFGREMREREKGEEGKEGGDDDFSKIELFRMYDHSELGKKLRELRPETVKTKEGGEDNWFSLQELSERLRKLREIEEKQAASRVGGVSFGELRASLQQLRLAGDDKAKKTSFQRFDILGQLSGTPSFMLSPPKEHLVEKYFHPDNMSSAEKLKLELKKVRDEFKMSESDCGSARVQIAQLTTEIKHLSSVLHKKDRHSRRGLIAKVHQRKKLLKYLRRTDWDSYCFVLSRLGLRDNPDYKS